MDVTATDTAIDPPGATGPQAARDFLGHPRGMAYLVATEAFERFSYYGMQALLVLYMTGHLLQPGVIEHIVGFASFRHGVEGVFGKLTNQALATQIFGLYGGSVYAAPILGSLIGDRFGRRGTVTVGLAIMVLGHFLMAFEPMFLVALAALLTGSSLLKGNVAAQIGALYAPTDSRLDQAYSYFYMSINIGGFLAPLVCGTLGEVYGWHYGFTSAGVIMLIGLGVYLSAHRHLPPDRPSLAKAARPAGDRVDLPRLAAMAALIAIAILFWTSQSQIWDTYNLWVRDRVDRSVFGLTVPVTWFQSIDSVGAVVLAPAVIWFWRRQADRHQEPGDLSKVAMGCFMFATTVLWLSLGELLAGHAQVPLIWPLAYHLFSAFGYLYFAPVIVAWFARSAPAAATGTVIAIYYLSIFAGSVASGWLSRFYGVVSNAEFWAIHAALTACGGVLLLLFRRPLTWALDVTGRGRAA